MRKQDGFWKRGEVWWTRLGGKRVTTGCKDLDAAKLWRREEERRRADPSYQAARATTLRRAINALLNQLAEEKAAAATQGYYEQKLASVAAGLGELLLLAELTAEKVDTFMSQRRAEGASEHTISKELGALRRVLRLAKRKRWTSTDYRDVLPIGHSPGYTPRKTKLSEGQLDEVLDQLPPERAAYLAFVVATGARRSELFRAQRGDVADRLVRLRGTKTAKADRLVPRLGLFASLLERAVRDAPGERRPGVPMFEPWQNARRDILQACKRARVVHQEREGEAGGPPDVTWNDLRRTHASWLRARGVEPQLLAELLGHTSSKMAEQVYGRIDAGELGGLLEQRLGASAPKARKAAPKVARKARKAGRRAA